MAKKYHSIKGKSALPLPGKPTFKQNEKTKEGVKFFEYWQDLAPELGPMARVRVYRMKPPIDLTKIGERVKSIQVWEGPIPFKAEDYEKEFYESPWGGGGDYRCQIEEIGLGGVICEAYFSLPDWDTFPPKVADGALMLESNGGKEYCQWRARRGDPVPGAPAESNEGDDFMDIGAKPSAGGGSTAAVLVGGLVDMAQSQITRAQQDADEAKKVAQEARATASSDANPNLTMQAASESIKLISDTSREMLKNSGAPDPVEMFKAIAGLIPAPAAPQDQTPMFNMFLSVMKQSNDTVVQMQQQTIQRLEIRLSEMDARAHAPATALATNGDGMAELEKFQKMASLLGYSRGGGEAAAPARPMAEVMAEWMPIINMGMSMVQTIVAAVTAPKVAPAAPPPAANGVPQTTAAPPPAGPPPDSPQAQMLKFMEKLEKPFLNHLLSPDYSGFDLARHIITDGNGGSMESLSGRAQYNQIKHNFGIRPDKTCGLDMLIQQYPPIWDIAKGDKPSYQRFLSEFFSYDEQVDQPPQKPS